MRLPTAYCLLPTAYCLLPTAYCLLPTAYCLLPLAVCRLPLAKAPRRHRVLGQRLPFVGAFSGYPILVSSSIHPIVIKAV
ncbi:hypothetical protein [Edwardsiella tarda]|uniref:hypothetical protein n=1 Tax=Edwardsiella tarda TaxID=636 RepID=UPI00098EBD28|nr:hypothetical protein [Edwardsiella tarda]